MQIYICEIYESKTVCIYQAFFLKITTKGTNTTRMEEREKSNKIQLNLNKIQVY